MQSKKNLFLSVFIAACALLLSASAFAQNSDFFRAPQGNEIGVEIPTLHTRPVDPATVHHLQIDKKHSVETSNYVYNGGCAMVYHDNKNTVLQVMTRPDHLSPYRVRGSAFFLYSTGVIATAYSNLTNSHGGIRVVASDGHVYAVDRLTNGSDPQWNLACLEIHDVGVETYPEIRSGQPPVPNAKYLIDPTHNWLAISYPQPVNAAFISPGNFLGWVANPAGSHAPGAGPAKTMLQIHMHCTKLSLGAPVFNQFGLAMGMVVSVDETHDLVFAMPIHLIQFEFKAIGGG